MELRSGDKDSVPCLYAGQGRTKVVHALDKPLKLLRVGELPVGAALRLVAAGRRLPSLQRAEGERAARIHCAQRQLQALRMHVFRVRVCSAART